MAHNTSFQVLSMRKSVSKSGLNIQIILDFKVHLSFQPLLVGNNQQHRMMWRYARMNLMLLGKKYNLCIDWILLINGVCVVFWSITIKLSTSHKNIDICVLLLFPPRQFWRYHAVIEEKNELYLRIKICHMHLIALDG